MKSDEITKYYEQMHNTPSDINEHLPTLRKYASKCKHITEMGVRQVFSTWGLIAGLMDAGGGVLKSMDIMHPSQTGGHGTGLDPAINSCSGEQIKFSFSIENSLDVDIEKTDLLFIDTVHVYKQLKAELDLHHSKVEKYIILHDTESCKRELGHAVLEFLKKNEEWTIIEHFSNNCGLTVLEKHGKTEPN
jgi:hypothetical protein